MGHRFCSEGRPGYDAVAAPDAWRRVGAHLEMAVTAGASGVLKQVMTTTTGGTMLGEKVFYTSIVPADGDGDYLLERTTRARLWTAISKWAPTRRHAWGAATAS